MDVLGELGRTASSELGRRERDVGIYGNRGETTVTEHIERHLGVVWL